MREDITIRQETHRDYKDIVSLIEYLLFKNPLSAFGAGARGGISTFLPTFHPENVKKQERNRFLSCLSLCVMLLR